MINRPLECSLSSLPNRRSACNHNNQRAGIQLTETHCPPRVARLSLILGSLGRSFPLGRLGVNSLGYHVTLTDVFSAEYIYIYELFHSFRHTGRTCWWRQTRERSHCSVCWTCRRWSCYSVELQVAVGTGDTVLDCIRSFLSGRTQQVV